MEPKELYEKLFGAKLYTDSYDQFKKDYGSDEGITELHTTLKAAKYYDGDVNSFREDYFQEPAKKKASGQPSGDSSSTPQSAPVAGKKYAKGGLEFNWSTGEVKQVGPLPKNYGPETVPKKQEYGLVVTEGASQTSGAVHSPDEIAENSDFAAYQQLQENRGTDFTTDAATLASERIANAGKMSASPLESAFAGATAITQGMSDLSKEQLGEPVPVRTAQKGSKEFSVFTAAITTDNHLIDRSIAAIDQEIENGGDIDELFAQKEQLTALKSKNEEVFYRAYASGQFSDAIKYQEYLADVQKRQDEEYKKKSLFGKAASNTGRVVLHSLAKVPQALGSLADVTEKALGMEGGTPGYGDFLQNTAMDLTDDIMQAVPAPTSLQRGGFTNSAKWGEFTVDFDKEDNISAIRDKDGFIANVKVTPQQQKEIMKLKKERMFHGGSFSYQFAQTFGDVGIQILGTKGLMAMKVAPGLVASRVGVGLKFTSLNPQVAMTIVNAGMMSSGLYKDAIDAGAGPDNAARYALGTGLGVGAVNALLGIGAESKFFNVGIMSKLPKINMGSSLLGRGAQIAGGFAVAGIGEGIEETGTERVVMAAANAMSNNLAGTDLDVNQWTDMNEILTEFGVSFATGGLIEFLKGGHTRPQNDFQRSLLLDAARNPERAAEAIRESAEALGQALDDKEEEVLATNLEEARQIIETTPEELRGDMEVVALMEQKVKLGHKISELKDEIKGLDESFTVDKKKKLEELEAKREELSAEIAKKSAESKKALKEAQKEPEVGGDGGEETNVDVGVEIIPPADETPQGVSIDNFDDLLKNDAARLSISEDGKNIEFEEFDVTIDRESMTAEVNFIKKKKRTENKGIGERAYIELGKKLKEQGITLTSTQTKLVGGHKVWEALEKKGYAKRVSSGMYEFVLPTETAPAEPQATPQPVVQSGLKPGEVYTRGDRDYKFVEEKDGVFHFEKLPKPGETLMNTKADANADSIFMMELTQKPAPGAQQPVAAAEPIGQTATPIAEPTPEPAAEQAAPPPSRPKKEKASTLGGKLRGFYERSLPKAAGMTNGKALLAKIGEENPQTYQQISIKGEADKIGAEIDADGIDVVIDRALNPKRDEDKRVTMARRLVALEVVGDSMVAANDANDTASLDELVRIADTLEQLIGEEGTLAGQTAALIGYYSMSPKGQVTKAVRKIKLKRDKLRQTANEQGKPIGEVVDNIVEEVSKEMGLTKEEVEEAIKNIYAKTKALAPGKKTVEQGKKDLEEARKKLRRALGGSLSAGYNPQVVAALVDIFKAHAKIFKGNIQKVKAAFNKDATASGLDAKEAWAAIAKEVKPLEDFAKKLEDTISGFYQGDLGNDLETALTDSGLDPADAKTLADELRANLADVISTKKAKRLKEIIKVHEKSEKKARAIENAVLEAIVLGGLDDNSIRQAVESKYGIKSFTSQQIAELNKMVMDMKDLPGEGLKRRALTEMQDYIRSVQGRDPMDFVGEMWFASVLSDIKTYGSILVGNYMNFLNNWVHYGLYTEGGRFAMKESMARLGKVGQLSGGVKQGVWFGLTEMANFARHGTGMRDMKKISTSGMMEVQAKKKYANPLKDAINKLVTTPLKMPLRLINASDALAFYTMMDFTLDRLAYNSAKAEGLTGEAAQERAREIIGTTKQGRQDLIEQARKELDDYATAKGRAPFSKQEVLYRAREIAEERLDAITPGASKKALTMAEEVSLQGSPKGIMGVVARALGGHFPALLKKADDLALMEVNPDHSHFQQTMTKGWNNLVKYSAAGTKIWAQLFFAFMKTAANMANMTSDFMPVLGVVHKYILDRIITLPNGMEPSLDIEDAEQVRVFWARQMEGSAIFAGILLYAMGREEDDDPKNWFITGSGNPDFYKKSEDYSKGWRPYTMHFGGKTFYYRDSPIGAVLAWAGALADAKRFEGEEDTNVPDVAMNGLSAYFTNASYLQSISGLNDGLSSGDASKVGLALINPVTGFVNPGYARMADRVFSPELRDSKTYENRFIGGLQAKTMIASNFLDLKYNSMGEPVDPYKKKSGFAQVTGMDKYITTDEPYNPVYDVLASKGAYFPKVGSESKALGTNMDYDELRDFTLMVGRYRRLRHTPNVAAMNKMDALQLTKKLKAVDAEAKLVAGLLVVDARKKGDKWTIEEIDKLFVRYEELIDRAKDEKKDIKEAGGDVEDVEIPEELDY